MGLPFTKMHGLGNDFIVIDDLDPDMRASRFQPITPEFAKKVCDRRFGVGADQILWLKQPQGTRLDARMEILNADGSVAEMCGNGIRAVALYLRKHGPRPSLNEYKIETLAGIKAVKIRGDLVTVDMGVPSMGVGFPEVGEEIEVLGRGLRFFEVNVGNPHAVIFVQEVEQFPVEAIGSAIERHPRFPARTNVEFVQLLGEEEIRVRVWERGAGITLACGTGACASAVAAIQTGKVKNTVRVLLPGGGLKISWKGPGQPILMEGPAQEVFRGELV